MNFSEALTRCKSGEKISRAGWNGKGMWVELVVHAERPGHVGPRPFPYLAIVYPVGHSAYPEGCRVPWLASQTDILADDWGVIIEHPVGK